MGTQKDALKACAPMNAQDLMMAMIVLNKIAQSIKSVRKLQLRIAKAFREKKMGRVHALQRILTRSLTARALAVFRVTTNKGKNTPGVDGILWKTPVEKANAVLLLKRRGYQPLPLRRIYIPKKTCKLRPLGIPTMHDRAMQAQYLLALIPIAEETADPNSYGFRPNRSTADAIEGCFIYLARKTSAQWILEGDIAGCFDNISHDWLLAHVPMDKVILRKWLAAGFIDQQTLFPTTAGTPQGGIISPTLANIALDGMERVIKDRFPTKLKIHIVKYADDFIITGLSKEVLEEEVRPVIVTFLEERGLELSQEKTKIVPIREGFEFLGQNVRKYGEKLLIKPSRKSVQALLDKVRDVLKEAQDKTQRWLIARLNPIIRGWANYHRHVVSKSTFGWVDNRIWFLLRSWLRKRHPKKTSQWIRQTYFQKRGSRQGVFALADGGPELFLASSTPIQRHVKIRGEAHPFDPKWADYLEGRKKTSMAISELDSHWGSVSL